MKKILSLLFILFSVLCLSQTAKDSLKYIILNADKIEIVSHKDLYVAKGKPGKDESFWKKIVKNGKPNKSIINERINLDPESINALLKILYQNPKTIIEYDLYCFEPHHAIFIYKKKKCSYIDICFGCRQISSSGDFLISENFMKSEENWSNLESFFRERKIEYKMPKRK